MKEDSRKKKGQPNTGKPISLKPLKFDEAVSDLLKVKPIRTKEDIMKAEIIVGVLYAIDGKELSINPGEQYEPLIATCECTEVKDEDWVLNTLGKRVRCKVIDGIIRQIEVWE